MSTVREYGFEASGSTIDALRHLQRPWRGWAATADALLVLSGTGVVVRIEAESAEPEAMLAVARLRAGVVRESDVPGGAVPEGDSAFGVGPNEVVLFNSETWVEEDVQIWGPPGARPDDARASCIVTDALLLDSLHGERLLVRCAPPPDGFELLRDPEEIAEYVAARGYDE